MLSHSPSSTAPVRLEDLPPALIDAAVRVCRELHNDPPEAVAAMVNDLRHWPADSWPWLIDHFTAQLPPLPTITADPAATCRGCLHSMPTSHPAILRCEAGIPSGLPIGGLWHTDQHACPEFTDRSTGAIRRPVTKTRDKTPTKTRDFSYDPFTE